MVHRITDTYDNRFREKKNNCIMMQTGYIINHRHWFGRIGAAAASDYLITWY